MDSTTFTSTAKAGSYLIWDGKNWCCLLCGASSVTGHTCDHMGGLRILAPKPLGQLVEEYLEDKFIEHIFQPIPFYDNGVRHKGWKKRNKRDKNGFQVVLKELSAPMLHEVVLPSLIHLSRPYKQTVKLAHYVPKKAKRLKLVKVQVY